jgi:hypothetical protein
VTPFSTSLEYTAAAPDCPTYCPKKLDVADLVSAVDARSWSLVCCIVRLEWMSSERYPLDAAPLNAMVASLSVYPPRCRSSELLLRVVERRCVE